MEVIMPPIYLTGLFKNFLIETTTHIFTVEERAFFDKLRESERLPYNTIEEMFERWIKILNV